MSTAPTRANERREVTRLPTATDNRSFFIETKSSGTASHGMS